MTGGGECLLSVRNLVTTFDTPAGRVRAVDGSTSTLCPAKSSAWSASRARASRCWGFRCCG